MSYELTCPIGQPKLEFFPDEPACDQARKGTCCDFGRGLLQINPFPVKVGSLQLLRDRSNFAATITGMKPGVNGPQKPFLVKLPCIGLSNEPIARAALWSLAEGIRVYMQHLWSKGTQGDVEAGKWIHPINFSQAFEDSQPVFG